MTEAQLRSLPSGAVVETGSGIRYTKLADGYFTAPYARRTSARRLVDPEHSRQPIKAVQP